MLVLVWYVVIVCTSLACRSVFISVWCCRLSRSMAASASVLASFSFTANTRRSSFSLRLAPLTHTTSHRHSEGGVTTKATHRRHTADRHGHRAQAESLDALTPHAVHVLCCAIMARVVCVYVCVCIVSPLGAWCRVGVVLIQQERLIQVRTAHRAFKGRKSPDTPTPD